ncbi:MAG: nuclease-related domain-containing protein, partial [Candidatus Thermoplasmatota archaeon]
KYELAQPRLSILPSGRLGRAADLDAPRRAILRTLNRGQLSVAAERLAKSYVERPAAEPAEADQLDAAVKDEFGFTLTQLIHLLVELMNIANDKLSQICVLQRAAVEAEITRRLDWGAEDAARGLRLFTLGPREKFLEPAGYARFEVYPWRYGRRLSYLRRPVIELPTGELLWGRRHVYAAVEYLIATLLDGRMFPQSKRLREYFGAQTEARGAEFEKSVANIAGRKGWLVRTGVKKIPTSTGTLRVPGDIDVLAVDERRRRIYVIECKNLAAARTPAEMQHEIEQLLLGNAKTRPAVTKHVERVGFVKENLNAVVAWLGLDQGKRWTLADAIVVDAPAFSPHLRQLATRILTAKEFEAH